MKYISIVLENRGFFKKTQKAQTIKEKHVHLIIVNRKLHIMKDTLNKSKRQKTDEEHIVLFSSERIYICRLQMNNISL